MIGFELSIVGEPRPRNWRMLLPQAEEASKAQHGIRHFSGKLVDHQTLDRPDLFAVGTAHGCSFHAIACDQTVGVRLLAFAMQDIAWLRLHGHLLGPLTCAVKTRSRSAAFPTLEQSMLDYGSRSRPRR